ncbi:MAG: hypothetical protein OXF44_10785 [Anaerolineaceae bacterium]|nr:hypothetical protein [Anaerolineaceae bacterium]
MRTATRRLFRLFFVLFWLILISTPCLALALASQGEIRLRSGPAPEEELRLWLVQDAQRAGLAISHVSRHDYELRNCFQTEARFLLWRGQQLDEETATTFCSCYSIEDETYQQQEIIAGSCPAPGVEADD